LDSIFYHRLSKHTPNMPPKKNSKWQDQEDAFFGNINPNTNDDDDSKKPAASATNHNEDEELAKKLQQQYIAEERFSQEQDRALALSFQQRNENGPSAGSDSTGGGGAGGGAGGASGRTGSGTSSRATATATATAAASTGGSRTPSFRNRKKKQEDEDAALARSMQEEEQSNNRPSPSLPSSPWQRLQAAGGGYTGGQQRGSGLGGLVPTCATCKQIVFMPISTLGNLYHVECFKCVGCHTAIDQNERFAYTVGDDDDDDDGIKYPLHKKCYDELYGFKCTVCQQTIKSENGRVSYIKHPFFDSEYMCPRHKEEAGRRCTGCHRFEPIGKGFAELSDADRCVCDSCLRSVIVDSNDAKPLWDNVIRFFRDKLNLPIWPGMEQIPILIVGHDALNDQMRNTDHGGSSQIMTRGLCLSEHQRGINFMLPSMRFDRKQASFLPSDAEAKGHTYFQIPDSSTSNPNARVTAILCLTGLPADLTASILAHEFCHAWIKLNSRFDVSKPIPAQVEEGCCQLIAMLFLNDGLSSASAQSDAGPSDLKLRQYFKFSIETDTNEVYGEGYRKAAKAYAMIGIEALLSHVVNYQELPVI